MIAAVILRSRNVLTPQGTRAAAIHIRDGRIERVADYDDVDGPADDFGDFVLMPGVVDSHPDLVTDTWYHWSNVGVNGAFTTWISVGSFTKNSRPNTGLHQRIHLGR